MSHKPISFHNVGLSFPPKVCFEDLTTQIHFGRRIALIGQNGSGKSSLLKMAQGLIEPTEGEIIVPSAVQFGFVPQIVEEFDHLSGGQRFHKVLTQALNLNPNVLLLDEPTNHLDLRNRRSLMRLLINYQGTLIVASHDEELLRTCVETLWHIEGGKVHIFSGRYEEYRQEMAIKRSAVEQEFSHLNRQKKEAHQTLMREQQRAKKSKLRGEKHIQERKWPTIVSDEKARRAIETAGRKKRAIRDRKEDLLEKLSDLRLPEVITPRFSLEAAKVKLKSLVAIRGGTCGYNTPLLKDIYFSVASHERVAIRGDNGSGKSTLLKAILGQPEVIKSGQWILPSPEDVGYLDQHYGTLEAKKTVLETISDLVPSWTHGRIREQLNDFLFRKNEEVDACVSTLSGGEKARLSLAQIAAKTPKLLILDEITNNLDLETRDHVIQVLENYPGALIVVSHDEEFLKAVHIESFYDIKSFE